MFRSHWSHRRYRLFILRKMSLVSVYWIQPLPHSCCSTHYTMHTTSNITLPNKGNNTLTSNWLTIIPFVSWVWVFQLGDSLRSLCFVLDCARLVFVFLYTIAQNPPWWSSSELVNSQGNYSLNQGINSNNSGWEINVCASLSMWIAIDKSLISWFSYSTLT